MIFLNERFSKPKGFGEILDLTFSLSRNKFKDFFIILLIFMGPIYLIQALIRLASGVSFFRETGVGVGWYEQIFSSFTDTESVNIVESLGNGLMGIISFFIFPVASAAILLAVHQIQKNGEFTIAQVIKHAFSRYGAIIGSTILFSLIVFGLVIVPFIFMIFIFIIGTVTFPTAGIIIGILLFLGLAVGIGYFLTRWSFYFGSAVLREGSPGLSRSWRLTRKRGWTLMGLYIVFFLINTVISLAVELTFSIFLGNSVLLTMTVSLVSIVTTLLFSVGYAVMYLDLKVRHDADDLKEMIESYDVVQ